MKKNKRSWAEATTEGAAPGPWPAGSLTAPDPEGHRLAARLLRPRRLQVAAVRRTPWKGQGSARGPSALQSAPGPPGSARLQMPK